MYMYLALLHVAAVLFLPSLASPLGFAISLSRAPNVLDNRAEPNTGDDLPDTSDHPNRLDQVETAFKDSLELANSVLGRIDTDTTIFPNYFDEGDRANVKKVYSAIWGSGDTSDSPGGNALLENILVQTTDTEGQCDDRTLAYTNDGNTDHPYIVLCSHAFNKKAITPLKGAELPSLNPDHAEHYLSCQTWEDNEHHVSYLMNSLGATLLHEYTHCDNLVYSIFSASIIDQPDGYGPVNVYNKLDKNLARLNADSYVYYASELMWKSECGVEFNAPRSGIDDADPDCGGSACEY